MNPTERTPADEAADDQLEGEESRPKLEFDLKVDTKSACERHITVTIAHDEVQRYFDDAFSKLMTKAEVPGFRPGRAPRKLVESRFRKDVTEQVKGTLLMDCLGQITDEGDLSPISEPDFDPTSVVVPDEGPMTFEFDIEVRPEFELPKWKGLKIRRPVKKFTAADVDEQIQVLLAQYGQLAPFDGPAGPTDYLTVNIAFKQGGQEVSRFDEQTVRIRPVLSFRDGRVDDFGKLIEGVRSGETRVGSAHMSTDAPNEALRGQTIEAEFHVLEVKKLELPELTPTLLEQLGGFGNEAEFREAVQASLERRLVYHQQQEARKQVLASLTVAADWDLPPEMLKRQSRREFERTILELRRSGFNEMEIRAHANELMQNSQEATARSLKEHFILERIAEDQKIEELPDDYDAEIALIAEQSGESSRRVRAQLEKRGLMDTLRNQIIERKVVELILEHADFKEVPYQPESIKSEAIDRAAGGDAVDIPEAKYGEAGTLERGPQTHE